MAELHIDKKTEGKAKPQAKPWKGFPKVGQAGKGLKPRLDPPSGWLSSGAEGPSPRRGPNLLP